MTQIRTSGTDFHDADIGCCASLFIPGFSEMTRIDRMPKVTGDRPLWKLYNHPSRTDELGCVLTVSSSCLRGLLGRMFGAAPEFFDRKHGSIPLNLKGQFHAPVIV